MKIRLNKYPFFLWLTQRRDDFKVDLNNNTVSSEELGKSSIKKIHFGWVILMRYITFFSAVVLLAVLPVLSSSFVGCCSVSLLSPCCVVVVVSWSLPTLTS